MQVVENGFCLGDPEGASVLARQAPYMGDCEAALGSQLLDQVDGFGKCLKLDPPTRVLEEDPPQSL